MKDKVKKKVKQSDAGEQSDGAGNVSKGKPKDELADAAATEVLDSSIVNEKELPVVEVVEQAENLGLKKVKVKFLKDLYPRVKIGNDWIEAKAGEVKVLTSMQARILRSDNTVT